MASRQRRRRTRENRGSLSPLGLVRPRPTRENPGVPAVPIGFPFNLDDEHFDTAITEMVEPSNWPGLTTSPSRRRG
jgi:hypothetical protein